MCLEDLNASELLFYLSGQYAALLLFACIFLAYGKKRILGMVISWMDWHIAHWTFFLFF